MIEPHDIAQAISYLKGSDIEVSLKLNVGKRAEHVRRVFENRNKQRHTPGVAK
jgi:hypothetical protein